jgi:hypothetical protein
LPFTNPVSCVYEREQIIREVSRTLGRHFVRYVAKASRACYVHEAHYTGVKTTCFVFTVKPQIYVELGIRNFVVAFGTHCKNGLNLSSFFIFF